MASTIRGNDNFDSSDVGTSTTFGDVGTYVVAYHQHAGSSSNFNGGATKSGSSLRAHMNPSSTNDDAYQLTDIQTSSKVYNPGLSGTWRLMVSRSQDTHGGYYVSALWVRIS